MDKEKSGRRSLGALPTRALIIMALDVVLIASAYFLALMLRFDFAWSQVPVEFLNGFRVLIPGTIVLVVGTLWLLKLYHSIWSFASTSELMRLMVGWVADSLLLPIISIIAGIHMPVSYWMIGGVLGFGFTAALRFSYRLGRILHGNMRREKQQKRVLMVGAGESGRALIHEIKVSPQLGMRVAAAIDDNPGKEGRYIEGVPIVGGRLSIADACDEHQIDEIIFAIPSCPAQERKEILELCGATGLEVRAIPGMWQLVDGRVTISKLRKVRLEDLLGREPIVVDAQEVRSFVEGRVVLVTGGGGSIGSELCRQIAKDDPKQLIIFDIYENNAYAIQQELRHDYPQLNLVTLIGSVRNEARVRSVFETYRPELVFHAAAHCAARLTTTAGW